jgi:hypothetical protein
MQKDRYHACPFAGEIIKIMKKLHFADYPSANEL